jgi:hypothetical protein
MGNTASAILAEQRSYCRHQHSKRQHCCKGYHSKKEKETQKKPTSKSHELAIRQTVALPAPAADRAPRAADPAAALPSSPPSRPSQPPHPAPASITTLIPVRLVAPASTAAEIQEAVCELVPVAALPPPTATATRKPTNYAFTVQGANYYITGTLKITDRDSSPQKSKQGHVLAHRSADGTRRLLRCPDGKNVLHGYEGYARIGETGDWFWIRRSDYV